MNPEWVIQLNAWLTNAMLNLSNQNPLWYVCKYLQLLLPFITNLTTPIEGTLVVDPVGGDDVTAVPQTWKAYRTIAAALAYMQANASANGFKVLLLPGVHTVTATLNVPSRAVGSIVGWGEDPSQVVIQGSTGPTAPLVIPANFNRTGWTLKGFTVNYTGASPGVKSLVCGASTLSQFDTNSGAGLVLENLQLPQGFTLQRLGRVQLRHVNSEVTCSMIGCAWVDVEGCQLVGPILEYASGEFPFPATTARRGYYLRGSLLRGDATDNFVQLNGAVLLYADGETRVDGRLVGSLSNGNSRAPFIRFAGVIGTTSDSLAGAPSIDTSGTPVANLSYGVVTPLLQGGNDGVGFDFSGARVYGDFRAVLPPLNTANPEHIQLGANGALFGNDVLIDNSSIGTQRYKIEFAGCQFGRFTGVSDGIITATDVDIYLSGCNYSESGLAATGTGTIWRPSALTENSPAVPASVAGFDAFTVPFPAGTVVGALASISDPDAAPIACDATELGVNFATATTDGTVCLQGVPQT